MNIEQLRGWLEWGLGGAGKDATAEAREAFDALVRDAERYRGIRVASMDARESVRSELDHYAACHLPHDVVDTIEKFDANTDDLIDAYKRIGARD